MTLALATAALGASGCSKDASDASDPTTAEALPVGRLVGRADLSVPETPRFAWSGSGAVASFEGSEVGVTLGDDGNQFTVLLDGELLPKLVTEAGERRYVLASDLPAGPHHVELYRRTEASFGPTRFLGFDFGEGRAVPEESRLQRRIEVIGDSISAAYGNEGDSPACGFSAETQNHYLSYVALSARELEAELSTVAWSGKGVVYHFDTDITDPMPALYDRILPDDPSSRWDYSTWPADAVVINLGTNDFSTADDPPPELFSSEYGKLLDRVRANYPDAFILCTVGPLLNGEDLLLARTGIAGAVQAFTAAGGSNIAVWEMNVANQNPGCDYHPGLETHRAMASDLTNELRAALDD